MEQNPKKTLIKILIIGEVIDEIKVNTISLRQLHSKSIIAVDESEPKESIHFSGENFLKVFEKGYMIF